jgi:SnoaL-like domain
LLSRLSPSSGGQETRGWPCPRRVRSRHLIAAKLAEHPPPLEEARPAHPKADNGRQAAKGFFDAIGPVDVDAHRIIAEGDLVVVHSHYETLGMAGADFFRLNEDGEIVEHWDVLQQAPETTASDNDIFSQLT